LNVWNWVFSLLLFLVFAHNSLDAQSYTLTEISFSGNKKTKDKYLKQFIFHPLDSQCDYEQLMADRQRIVNQSGIFEVLLQLDTLDNHRIKANFDISEQLTLLPIFNLGVIEDNAWFQIGMTDFNWLGRGQEMVFYYQNTDQRHTAHVYYRIPYLKNNRWGLVVNALKWASIEPLYFTEGVVRYEYDNNSLDLGLIRHISDTDDLDIAFSVFEEKYKQAAEQELINPPGPQSFAQVKFLGRLQYKRDRIRYLKTRLDGFSWTANSQVVYNTDDGSFFNTGFLQARYFKSDDYKGNLASRIKFALSTNVRSPFAPFVVDSRVNLRGSGNRIDRGTAQFIWNIEYRGNLLSKIKEEIKPDPSKAHLDPPGEMVVEKLMYSMQWVIFSDFGSWRRSGGELEELIKSDGFRHFVGGGVRLIYPPVYNAVLRIDYGIDLYNPEQHGIVIGLGQYF